MSSLERRSRKVQLVTLVLLLADVVSPRYCDAFPDVKTGWLDALGPDHDKQEDFLARFSVGAALVQTSHRDADSNESNGPLPSAEGEIHQR